MASERSTDVNAEPMQRAHYPVDEKTNGEAKHLEDALTSSGNLVYDNDEEPEIHARTYIALAAMFLLNMVQVLAFQGPPAVVRNDQEVNFLLRTGLTSHSSPT